MHLIFKNLKIFNFLSFSESELQFNNQGYVLVNGINNNKEDLAKSNGSGKCFAENTKVMMWDGTIKNVQDIKVNDIVMGWDSTPRIVLETHSGYGPLYKVSGNFGYDDYTYICNDNHILTLKKTCGSNKGKIIDIPIKDYLVKCNTPSWKACYNQFIMPITSYYNQKTDLPIDPYFLGLWLGDGTSSSLSITNMDKEVIDFIYEYANSLKLKVKCTNQHGSPAKSYTIARDGSANSINYAQFRDMIKNLNILNNKHIPHDFLTSSTDNRLKLLAGLIDTDGWLQGTKTQGYYCITQKSDRLSSDIMRVAQSLGFKCSLKKYLNKKYNKYYNLISIKGKVWDIPVKIARKKIYPYKLQRPFTIKPTITSNGKGNYYGFSITGDGRFLLSNGLVVHNSSLFESIIWCLTGETIRGTKEIVNRKFPDKGAYVELTFSIDKNEYKITRYKDYPKLGSNLKIIINGEDKSGKGIRDSEKLLEQYLPDLNAQLLGSVVILGQGLPQRFTNNTPSGRKEVLEKLSKSDFMIEDIKNKLISRKAELNSNLRKVEDSILADTSSKNVLESQLRKEEDEYKSIPFIDFDNDFAYYQTNIERSENDLNLKEKHYENIFDETQKVKQEYLLLNTKLEEFKLKCANDHNEQVSPLVKESFRLDYEINSLKKEIESYKNMKDVCPTCGQKLPDFHRVDTSEMEIKLDILIKDRENNKKLIEDLKQKWNSKVEDYEKNISYEKNSIGEKQKTLTESYNLVAKEIADLKLNLNKLKSDFQNLQYLKEKLDNYSNHIEDLKNQINQFSEKILYYNMEKDKINSHIDVVSKMSTIATRDFRGFLLSEIINFINIRAKEYAKDIIESDKINFYLDGNNINITYCDKQYEGLSGGEKQKADLIIQFSIRDMLVKFLNFSSNILVLDEIFDALDSVGCERVVNLISNKLNDIESVYIISHRVDSLAIPMDNEIIIVKDENGISKVN